MKYLRRSQGWLIIAVIALLVATTANIIQTRKLKKEFNLWTEETARMPDMIHDNATAIGRLSGAVESLAGSVETNADTIISLVDKVAEDIWKVWSMFARLHGEWEE